MTIVLGTTGSDELDDPIGDGDFIYGFEGSDTFRMTEGGSDVVFAGEEGFDYDRVSYASYSHGILVNLELQSAIDGVDVDTIIDVEQVEGTAFADVLVGDAFYNFLYGADGGDVLRGGGGDDVLGGGSSTPIEPDIMFGEGGDDHYWIDEVWDVASEEGGAGYDYVIASIDYNLSNPNIKGDIEGLYLDDGVISGTGNGLSNEIHGNNLDNWLDGGAGADVLVGDRGNDTYIVDNAGDVVDESFGGKFNANYERVFSSVSFNLGGPQVIGVIEDLILTGSAWRCSRSRHNRQSSRQTHRRVRSSKPCPT